MMTYSFIIPHHNNPELLDRCIASIPERDDVQIIVVDDNSVADRQPNVLREGVEVMYIDEVHTRGAGHARNVGMAKAAGKWLMFADCDDYYKEGFVEVLDRYKDEEIDVLYFNYDVIDGKTHETRCNQKLQSVLDGYDDTVEKSDWVKYRNNDPWTKMVSHQFVVHNGISFEEVPNGNDVLFSLMIAAKCDKMAVCRERLYNYILTPGSIGRKKQSVDEMMCRVTHFFKHNSVNRAIGHGEWNESFVRYLYYELLVHEPLLRKIYLAVVIMSKVPKSFFVRRQWVKMINL